MDADAWLRSVRGSRELWGAVSGAAVLAAGGWLVRTVWTARPPQPAVIFTGGVLTGLVVGSWSRPVVVALVLALAVATLLPWPRTGATHARLVANSWVGAWFVYVGVPETKRSIAVVGAVVVAGVLSLVSGREWWSTAHVATVAFVVVSVVDSAGRMNQLLGGLAVAAIHVLVVHSRVSVRMLGVAWVAMAVSARVAGLSRGAYTPAVLACVCVLVVVAAAVLDRSERWGTGHDRRSSNSR